MSANDPTFTDDMHPQPPPVPPSPPPPPETEIDGDEAQPRRKSSFSEALNKFTSNTFARRRTTNTVPSSSSLAVVHPRSRIPTPAGVPRNTSYVSTFNNFTSTGLSSTYKLVKPKDDLHSNTSSASTDDKENEASPTKPTFTLSRSTVNPINQPADALWIRREHTPHRRTTEPVTPTSVHKSRCSKNRESSVQIMQRQLMQPLGPPVTRRETMGALVAGSPASVMCSASASRRSSGLVSSGGSGSGGGKSSVEKSSVEEVESERRSPLTGREKMASQRWDGSKSSPNIQTNVRQVNPPRPAVLSPQTHIMPTFTQSDVGYWRVPR